MFYFISFYFNRANRNGSKMKKQNMNVIFLSIAYITCQLRAYYVSIQQFTFSSRVSITKLMSKILETKEKLIKIFLRIDSNVEAHFLEVLGMLEPSILHILKEYELFSIKNAKLK